MLLGEFNHSIDEKGRLIIPAKLRDDLGDSFVICNGLEGCLFVYSQEEWNKFVAELDSILNHHSPFFNPFLRFFCVLFSAKNESKNRIFRKKRTCMALMFQIPYMLCF